MVAGVGGEAPASTVERDEEREERTERAGVEGRLASEA